MPKENKKIIKDALSPTDLAAGGILLPSQARRFLRMVFDVAELYKQCRTIIMPTPQHEIDKIGVGSRVMRGAAIGEDVSAYTKKPTFGKIELNALKYVLPWEILKETLKDNIEGKSLGALVAKMFATQMGLDTEDMGINGDKVYDTTQPSDTVDMVGNIDATTDPIDIIVDDVAGFPRTGEAGWIKIDNEYMKYTVVDVGAKTFKDCARAQNGSTIATHSDGATVTWERDPLLGTDYGWLAVLYNGGGNYIDLSGIQSGAIKKDHFFALLNKIPRKYTRGQAKSRLRWCVNSQTMSDYMEYLTDRVTAGGDAILGGAAHKPLGIPFMEIPSLPYETILLTDPKNLILGIWQQIEIAFTDKDKESVMAGKIFYNASVRMDFQIEEADALAYGDGLVQ